MGRVPVRLLSVLVALIMLGGATDVSSQTPSPPEGWVVLPVDEYRALRERTAPSRPPSLTPLDATLTRVDYDLRMEGDTIAGRALLTIDMLRDGWTRVPIPAGLMVRDASLNGQPVSLFEGPPAHVLLTRAGRIVLTLDIALPVATAAGTDSIALPSSPSVISRATLTLPRNGVELTVKGGFIAERAEDARQSRWQVYGQPNQPLALAWKRKVDDRRSEQPVRLRARVIQVVGLGEDTSQVAASVRVEVVQGLAREVTLALPQGLSVNQVNGATVADWDATGGSLRVRLLEPVSTEASFVVLGETHAPREGTVVVPLVRVPSAERESGGVAVDVVGAGEVAGRLTRGLDPADPSELGDIVTGRESPSMMAFRLRHMAGTEPRALSVEVVRYTPQAVLIANIEEARYRALAAEDGRLLVEARYAVRNNQRSFLKVSMPSGSSVWTATVAGRPTRPGVAEAGAVLLPLEKGRAGEEAPTFVVTLVYLQRVDAWPDKGILGLTLPAVDLPVSRTGLRLYHSPRFRVVPEPGAFRVEDDPGPFSEAMRARPSSAPRMATAPPQASGLVLDQSRVARESELQTLVDRFRNESGIRTVAGSLPVDVAFPDLGPSLFVVSELTADGRAPVLGVKVKRTKR